MGTETKLEFCQICGTEVETPTDTLSSLAEAPEVIAAALRETPEGARDGWSPAEVATHLADTEVVTG